MSHIGKQKINIPEKAEIKITKQEISVKGPKGELKLDLPRNVKVEKSEDFLNVSVKKPEVKQQRSLWGTFARLISNMIHGVTEGFKKELEMVGVGYKANVKGDTLVLSVGFSHDVSFKIPENIEITAKKTDITIEGIDKQRVNQIAAEIRSIRKPEPYKGKGIKYKDEIIQRKAGKKAVSGDGVGA
ncbi:MAG TPA: 50S ribosomal protein L6 [Patescibacteria group bacterium]|nr:50S ribosomal protein L6 [Patescibacteria group bacterium]